MGHPETTRVTRRSEVEPRAWKAAVRARIDAVCAHHKAARRSECRGLDLRLSAPFVRSEVMRADVCLELLGDEGELHAFAYVYERREPTALCLALLCSLRPGCGTRLVRRLLDERSHPMCEARHLVTRATTSSVGFYLKLGMRVQDWTSCVEFLGRGGDWRRLTGLVASSRYDEAHRALVARGWDATFPDEWPLVGERLMPDPPHRRSERLR